MLSNNKHTLQSIYYSLQHLLAFILKRKCSHFHFWHDIGMYVAPECTDMQELVSSFELEERQHANFAIYFKLKAGEIGMRSYFIFAPTNILVC